MSQPSGLLSPRYCQPSSRTRVAKRIEGKADKKASRSLGERPRIVTTSRNSKSSENLTSRRAFSAPGIRPNPVPARFRQKHEDFSYTFCVRGHPHLGVRWETSETHTDA